MAREWVKLHTSMLGHAATMMLPPEAFKCWIVLLMMAGMTDDEGRAGTLDELAYSLRCSRDDAARLVGMLGGRANVARNVVTIRDWDEWQPRPDPTNAERQARHRAKLKVEGVTASNGVSNAAADAPGNEVGADAGNAGSNSASNDACNAGSNDAGNGATRARDPYTQSEEPREPKPLTPRAPKPRAAPKPDRRAERKPLYDAYCQAFGLPEGGGRHRSLAGEFDRDCSTAGATADEFAAFVKERKGVGDWSRFITVSNVTRKFLAWRDERLTPAVPVWTAFGG